MAQPVVDKKLSRFQLLVCIFFLRQPAAAKTQEALLKMNEGCCIFRCNTTFGVKPAVLRPFPVVKPDAFTALSEDPAAARNTYVKERGCDLYTAGPPSLLWVSAALSLCLNFQTEDLPALQCDRLVPRFKNRRGGDDRPKREQIQNNDNGLKLQTGGTTVAVVK